MLSLHDSLDRVSQLFKQKDKKSRFLARQLLFLNNPLSKLVELYLYNNEGRPQTLDKFPMMRAIYDGIPRKLLLKCSRKTLKSTLISNIIVLNMLRYEYYRMMYISPNEESTKKFSHNYLAERLASPAIKKIITRVFPNDVLTKGIADSHSNIILTYANEDANRTRGPATDQNIFDEVQGMSKEIIPVVNETMALSDVQREIYAGTPLTSDNSLNQLWQTAHQMEWFTKCTGCNHWNALIESNEPLKMVRKAGLSCSKCGNVIDTSTGLWVDYNPGDRPLYGFHMAQPMLPFYNQNPKKWEEIYDKVYGSNAYSTLQVYNEVFGLPYDIGSKPITKEEIMKVCVLGEIKTIYARNRHRYLFTTMGVDWGVNPTSSRTVACVGGMREDGVLEVFDIRIFKNTDYEQQIRDLANIAKGYGPLLFCDSGPDAIRGKMLGNMYDPSQTQLVVYKEGIINQEYQMPPNALDWSQARWSLNRSEVLGFTLNLIKKGKILLPRWEDTSEAAQDILAVFTEVQEDKLKARIFYRHNEPDDFLHALTWCVCSANLRMGNSFFTTHDMRGFDQDN